MSINAFKQANMIDSVAVALITSANSICSIYFISKFSLVANLNRNFNDSVTGY